MPRHVLCMRKPPWNIFFLDILAGTAGRTSWNRCKDPPEDFPALEKCKLVEGEVAVLAFSRLCCWLWGYRVFWCSCFRSTWFWVFPLSNSKKTVTAQTVHQGLTAWTRHISISHRTVPFVSSAAANRVPQQSRCLEFLTGTILHPKYLQSSWVMFSMRSIPSTLWLSAGRWIHKRGPRLDRGTHTRSWVVIICHSFVGWLIVGVCADFVLWICGSFLLRVQKMRGNLQRKTHRKEPT